VIARIEALIKRSQQLAARPGIQRTSTDVALLIARIALAWIFIYHGAGTLFSAFGGQGIHGMSIYFASTAHLHPGTFFAVLSGITEFFGGIAVGVGVLGRFAAVGLFGDMVIAMITVTFKNGLESSAAGSGYEINIALAALAAAVVLLGTGRLGVGFLVQRAVSSRHREHPRAEG